jgi:hypothetical protein
MAMRKLYVPGLLLCAVIAGCETKTPSGPSGVTPTTSTTTTSVPAPGPTTTSSTTTTSVVIAALARRYTAFNPPANVPSDMTLFFELLGGAGVAEPTGVTTGRRRATENEYKVTGVFIMANGTTGTVTGELGGSDNPLETGGEFEGSLTATMPSGCTALRDFDGTITGAALQWSGGAVGTTSNPCSPNPLMAFSNMSMLRFDTGAPLPTPPPTTSSIATTTTTISCTDFSLSPSSDTVGSAGGVRTVNLTAPAGCAWSAQSYADWITVHPPYGGSGSATITYTVAATTVARTGTLLIGGIGFLVSQGAPVVPADLVHFTPVGESPLCRTDDSGNLLIGVSNQGAGNAGASVTRVVFTTSGGAVTTDMPTPALAAGSPPVDVTFDIPGGCYISNCTFTSTVNATGTVTESSTANNSAPGFCLG